MATIELRPDFKTVGGETMDVMLDDTYAGSLFLLYREQARMQGVFVMDQEAVNDDATMNQLEAHVERYVQHLCAALGARELEVSFLACGCSKVLSLLSEWEDLLDIGADSITTPYDDILIEKFEEVPNEEMLANLEVGFVSSQLQRSSFDDIQVLLARDDGDTLLYDVYSTTSGSLPLGTATIDTNGEQLSGYIDFRVPGTSKDRDRAAQAIMQELLKEQSFTALHLNMMFHNEIIDECLLAAVR
ncbi:hypothetical protein [Paenibacillus sp. UMB4589-SE434]|uniref:hypothetical protein n=1 Tax=Paenibacillus sp. UMB4589-SE434 TaxID=3046314 RepID=UPI00254EE65B|nr:hypothetical protein [Paenibacillus sp. UMB4589-SE434]MDK8182526.1 hypothetical protein [Paenibacillus sp. UMB4589-SE434]